MLDEQNDTTAVDDLPLSPSVTQDFVHLLMNIKFNIRQLSGAEKKGKGESQKRALIVGIREKKKERKGVQETALWRTS